MMNSLLFKMAHQRSSKASTPGVAAEARWARPELAPRTANRSRVRATPLIEECSPGPYLELFARNTRPGWDSWGNEVGKFGEVA